MVDQAVVPELAGRDLLGPDASPDRPDAGVLRHDDRWRWLGARRSWPGRMELAVDRPGCAVRHRDDAQRHRRVRRRRILQQDHRRLVEQHPSGLARRRHPPAARHQQHRHVVAGHPLEARGPPARLRWSRQVDVGVRRRHLARLGLDQRRVVRQGQHLLLRFEPDRPDRCIAEPHRRQRLDDLQQQLPEPPRRLRFQLEHRREHRSDVVLVLQRHAHGPVHPGLAPAQDLRGGPAGDPGDGDAREHRPQVPEVQPRGPELGCDRQRRPHRPVPGSELARHGLRPDRRHRVCRR